MMQTRSLAVLFAALALAPLVDAQDFTTNPVDIFAGCDADARAPAASPRDRMADRNTATVDHITQRSFASFSMDEIDRGVPGEMSSLCWARLDGVWRETGQITLDNTADLSDVWESDVPETMAMANGTYTTPRHIVIVESDDPQSGIYLSTGLSGAPFVKFLSTDGIRLEDVLQRGGARKTYDATGRFEYGQRMIMDVTRSGRIRLMLGSMTFIRPGPGVSAATASNQLALDDAFLLSYNLDNLAASRRGYDVITQDPFYLLNNPKLEVFAKVDPQNYYITEKRTVPVGFSLIQENSQGMVYRKTLVTTEEETQRTISNSFGAEVGAMDDSLMPYKSKVGFNFAVSSFNSMRQSETVAQAIGYSRAKQYALVVDHPYITLSDDFIDAVEDARRYFRYQALIDKFGTHYPYAVTYGAAARFTQSFSEKSYSERASRQTNFDAEASGSAYGVGGKLQYAFKEENVSGTSGTVSDDNIAFVAVGGNGSWDQNGYSAGNVTYPILLDLRPIWELLNPMNFPGEPQIYDTVRRNLQRATIAYMQKSGRPLSTTSYLPEFTPFKPEPVETWIVYIRHIWCTGAMSGRAKSVRAESITISASGGAGDVSTTKTNGLEVDCKLKRKVEEFDYNSKSPGLLVVKGTRQDLESTLITVNMDWKYDPGWTTRSAEKKFAGALKGLADEERKDHVWKVSAPSLPDFYLRVRFKRKN